MTAKEKLIALAKRMTEMSSRERARSVRLASSAPDTSAECRAVSYAWESAAEMVRGVAEEL